MPDLKEFSHGLGYGADGFAFAVGQCGLGRRNGSRTRGLAGRGDLRGLRGELGLAGDDCGDCVHQFTVGVGLHYVGAGAQLNDLVNQLETWSVKITMPAVGRRDLMARRASSPLIPGMLRSITTTSGRS